jgi:amidophosphoribosyltransferase
MKSVRIHDDRFHDQCGVFGVFGHPEAAHLTYLGLHALQHRGQESAGIVSSDSTHLHSERGMGHVGKVFSRQNLERLVGRMAIGHVRYSTAGETRLANAQPLRIESGRGEMAIAHNGNLVNAAQVRSELERTGSIFQTTSDTEVILHLIARSERESLEEAVVDALQQVEGAFSLIFLFPEKMIAVRDPRGFRPLSLGRLGSATLVTSESCALDLIDAEFVRDLQPGEMMVVTEDGTASYHPFPEVTPSPCIFEYVYFARPDSLLYGRSVNIVRKRLGMELARERPAQADLVVPVPDSGVSAALGYAEESAIPFEFGLVRNHYVGRTFIEPRQSIRHFGVKLKLNPVRNIIEGRRVVLVDDSIVRGTTSRKIVAMVRAAGAREVHMRISSPPTTGPCHYGIDTPRRSELIASSHSVEEICKFIQADSLGYLSRDGMYRAVGDLDARLCDACFTGNYPVVVPREGKPALKTVGKDRRSVP